MKSKKQKKKNNLFSLSNILLVIILLAGLSLLLYPTFSNQWNKVHQSRAVASYTESVEQMDDGSKERMLEEAREYNKKLSQRGTDFRSNPDETEYWNTLKVTEDGMMGYIEIPKLNVKMSIYHGTEEAILQVAAGHLQGSSLPVGGESTHCVLSGHTGLPSAKLFTDLDQLEEGDKFKMTVLDETVTYQVDQIRVVLPDELDDIGIEEGKDLCTLVTCTPYGVNSHRLLVRGFRVENEDENHFSADAIPVDTRFVGLVLAVVIVLLVLLFYVRIRVSKKKHKESVDLRKEEKK